MAALSGLLENVPVASLLLGVIIPLIIYWYFTKNHDYWAKRGIPFVKPYPLIGSIPSALTESFENSETERYKTLGKIYGFFEGNKLGLTIADPDLVKDILVKDFQYFSTRRVFDTGNEIFNKMLTAVTGEDWKRIRTIVTPTFTTSKIRKMIGIFEDCTKTLLKNFSTAHSKGESINVLKLYGAFTMDVIASSSFSTKIDSHNDPENEFVRRAKAAFDQNIGIKFLFFIAMPTVMRKLGISPFDNDNVDFFTRVTLDIIEERRRSGTKGNDFLQILLDIATDVAKEEKWDEQSEDITANYGDNSTDHPVFTSTNSKSLSMNELVAQCVIFFLAGYHTTATTLSLATHLLAVNPEVQEKAFKEVKDVLEETNGEFKYESVQKLKYLDNVISETLRMYSPVIRLDRTATADYKLSNTDIQIPKGTLIGIPVTAMHHDPNLFPDPEKFDPDRFSPERKDKQIPPYTYLPFGSGPRNCVGMRFALMEMKTCLVYVLSSFHAEPCSETKNPMEFCKTSSLIKPKSVMLNMVPRKDSPLKLRQ